MDPSSLVARAIREIKPSATLAIGSSLRMHGGATSDAGLRLADCADFPCEVRAFLRQNEVGLRIG